ncbi:conserved hypothetical protein [Trichinella spiralis]|uniref:hypothetical protein n=1 Tax=Trichinella spiralis TaxID=6334 RepID=UPI0001EFBFC1|nr:conserved hypothetical protein [Trichinella spiralis]
MLKLKIKEKSTLSSQLNRHAFRRVSSNKLANITDRPTRKSNLHRQKSPQSRQLHPNYCAPPTKREVMLLQLRRHPFKTVQRAVLKMTMDNFTLVLKIDKLMQKRNIIIFSNTI